MLLTLLFLQRIADIQTVRASSLAIAFSSLFTSLLGAIFFYSFFLNIFFFPCEWLDFCLSSSIFFSFLQKKKKLPLIFIFLSFSFFHIWSFSNLSLLFCNFFFWCVFIMLKREIGKFNNINSINQVMVKLACDYHG